MHSNWSIALARAQRETGGGSGFFKLPGRCRFAQRLGGGGNSRSSGCVPSSVARGRGGGDEVDEAGWTAQELELDAMVSGLSF